MSWMLSSLVPELRRRAGIEGLFVFGWAGSLGHILIFFIALFFAFGFWWPYWRAADMDTWMVYEAFLFNDGLDQTYFAHPGYLTILLLGLWFDLLHAAGLLSVHALFELPPVSDIAASASAWMRATQAARLLSLGYATVFIAAFAFLLRRFLRDWRVATLATFALAFSGGLMMEARVVRTELLAAAFAYSALLILLLTPRCNERWRVVMVGFASMLATLAMVNKIQIIFPLMTFPPILYVFAESPCRRDAAAGRVRSGIWLLVASAIAAIAAVIIAVPIVMADLYDPAAVAQRTSLFGTGFPVYQAAVAAWVALWLAAYARKFHMGAIESLSAAAALAAGAGLGLLVLDIRFNSGNAIAVMNPFERMLEYAVASNSRLGEAGAMFGGPMIQSLLSGTLQLLERLTFVLRSSSRPTVFLEWAVFAMMVFAWRRGKRKEVFQAALLIASASAVDLVGTLRGLKNEYFILTDPLVILAAVWLLVRVPGLQTHRLTYPVGAALMVATVAVGLAEPVKHTFKRSIPQELCTPHFDRTERIEHFSFCP
jgi:hypothetical protein